MSERKRTIKGEHGLIVMVPEGDLPGQYLWFGNEDGRYVGTLSHKTKLKKLRRWIDEILAQPAKEAE